MGWYVLGSILGLVTSAAVVAVSSRSKLHGHLSRKLRDEVLLAP